MSSFIKESKSVPPARTSASAQLLPNKATACSLVVGLAYSNARILFASLLFESCKNSIRRKRQSRNAYANSICYCVRDDRAWRHNRRLAQANHPSLVITLAGHHMHDQLSDIAYARQLVELHVGVEHAAGLLVHDLLFVERVTNTHYQSTVDLALCRFEINDQPTILDCNDLVDAHDSSFNIDGDVRHLCAAYALIHELPWTWVLTSDSEWRCPELRTCLSPGHRFTWICFDANGTADCFQVFRLGIKCRRSLGEYLIQRVERGPSGRRADSPNRRASSGPAGCRVAAIANRDLNSVQR